MKLKQNQYLIYLLLCICFFSCKPSSNNKQSGQQQEKKIAVLLVNHGSRSETWRKALLSLEQQVDSIIRQDESVQAVRTAFMEYTEPSIATRLREFDQEGFTDVVMVPVFLTVSSHSFDDIPTLIGQKDDPKSIELFKIEKMERYKPKATVHIAPLLDFTDLLQKNILRRYRQLAKDPKKEGLTLIAYGDKTYNTEWSALMDTVGRYVQQQTGMPAYSYGWCGHVANYQSDSTTVAIQQVLKKTERAVVLPVLVAFDEMFQIKIIGDGINKIANNKNSVIYKPDAILPDPGVQEWVIQTSRKYVHQIIQKGIVQR
ncbi:MAG: hypothetical protein RLY16_816 [Bacteroidota bacterium]|jgi:hypothetical protein